MVTPAAPRRWRVLARRYHLLRVLGRGAMGAVWEAEDTFLRRTVAVKEVVLPGSLSPEERAVSAASGRCGRRGRSPGSATPTW